MTSWKLCLAYLQCYFISIATILGTGVLGLPVTLYKAGFYPFLVTFAVGYIVQMFVIFLMLELLQYTKAVLNNSNSDRLHPVDDSDTSLLLSKNKKDEEHILFDISNHNITHNGESSASEDEKAEEELDKESEDDESGYQSLNTAITEPNLHIMGKLFLNQFWNFVYLAILPTHFLSILISYSLAGSQAFGQVFDVDYIKIIPAFTWILAIIIIVGRRYIQPVIAVITLAKGSLLFTTILVTMYTGGKVNRNISDDWKYIQSPFLIGIVALGGIPMVMPMLFDKFEVVRDQMKGFRLSLICGITTCFLLNILWCWSVLKIVPQTIEDCLTTSDLLIALRQNVTTTTAILPTGSAVDSVHECDPKATLEAADDAGQISTVPLSKIILTDHAELKWIAFAIQIFILFSVTVSFLTLGSALQHTVSGWIDDIVSRHQNCKMTTSCCSWFPKNWFWHYLGGILCFLVVFLVAWSDPKGFIAILSKVASFGLNFMSGPFIFLTIRSVRSKLSHTIRIPLATSEWIKHTHYIALIYYSFGIIYDIVVSIIDWVNK